MSRAGGRAAVGLGLLPVGYATVVAALTWPLAAHLRTQIPATGLGGRFDSLLVAWALAWQSCALVTAPWTWAQGNIFHPASATLFYGEAGFGALPYFAPVFLVTGNPALALNVTLLAGVVLTALALHWVAWRWTGTHVADAVAAWMFLPLDPAGADLPELQAEAMYRSIAHGRPLLNGYNGYFPAGFPQRMESARLLPIPSALDALYRATGVDLVWVHLDALPAAQRVVWRRAQASCGAVWLEEVVREGSEALFRVRDDPLPCEPARGAG